MFNLLPRDTVFYDLFEGMSGHGVNVAGYLQQLAQKFPDITSSIQPRKAILIWRESVIVNPINYLI